MEQHSAGKGGSLRRAWISAWIVTLAMGGTTMAFQVYHSVKHGHMPWPLAGLYGVVPLLIAMLVLEIVAEWRAATWAAKATAYAIMAGAMYLSASATGAVVLDAAPPHFSLLFGALLDAAELLAAYFIMNGPRAVDAAAQAAAEAEREAALQAAIEAERAALRADLDAARAGKATAESETASVRAELESAEREAAEARERAEALAQKLAAVSDRKARKQPAKNAQRGAPENAQGDDVTTELRALMELKADPELRQPRMGGELARRLGVSPATGRRLHSRLTAQDAPADPLSERSAEEPDARSDERS